MRKVCTLLFICFCSIILNAQSSDILLKLNHKSGDQELVLNTGKYNTWNGVPYYFTRFQYYVSGITITHDGGTVTKATDVVLLANPKSVIYPLGNYDIQNIEKIEFNIGVDSKVNHGDPTLFPAGHPLSPQNPSMHWGWAAGYRFAAIEGYADSGNGLYADLFEFHPIGDKLYTKVIVDVIPEKDVDGNLVIELNADYNKLFNTIDLTGGMIMHGDLPPLPQFMLNFKEVFTDANSTASTDTPGNDIAVTCCNSASSALIQFSSIREGISFNLLNLQGQNIYQEKNLGGSGSIQLPDPLPKGLYFISFTQSGKVLYTSKIVIQY